jgi:hypothetical protein
MHNVPFEAAHLFDLCRIKEKTNWVNPKLYRNEKKRTWLVQNFTERIKTNWLSPKLYRNEKNELD